MSELDDFLGEEKPKSSKKKDKKEVVVVSESEALMDDNVILEKNEEQVKVSEKEYTERELDMMERMRRLEEMVESMSHTPTKGVIVTERTADKFGIVGKREIPKEDKLDKPKTYVAIGRGLVLSVYMLEGSEVYAPYNRPIKFSLSTFDRRATAHGEKVLFMSNYATWSKKECEFIEKSPYFNVTIFDVYKKAINIDPDKVVKLEQATSWVNSLTPNALFANAIQYGMDTALGTDAIKKHLMAIKLAELMSEDEALLARRFKDREAINEHIGLQES